MTKKRYKPQELLEKINEIFPDVKYIAKYADGRWSLFDLEPNLVGAFWEANEKGKIIEGVNIFTKIDYEGSWQDSLHSIEEDEIPDENTPSGTLVEVRDCETDEWNTAIYIGFDRAKDGACRHVTRFISRTEFNLWKYCRIKKGE